MASLAAKTGISGEKTKTQKIGIGHVVEISFAENAAPTAFEITKQTKDTPIGRRLIGEIIPTEKTSFTIVPISNGTSLNPTPMIFYVHSVK